MIDFEFDKRTAQRKLDTYFSEVRAQFFPRWDSRQEWRIVAESRNGKTGYCDSKAKEICICPRAAREMLDDGVRAIIIHEICHDVATAHHREPWIERMEKAAKKAETLERRELAHQIRASAYSHIPGGTPWHVKWCKYFYPLIEAHQQREREAFFNERKHNGN